MTTSIVEGRKEKIPLYGSLRMDAPPMARADGSLTSSSSSRPTLPASRPATPCS